MKSREVAEVAGRLPGFRTRLSLRGPLEARLKIEGGEDWSSVVCGPAADLLNHTGRNSSETFDDEVSAWRGRYCEAPHNTASRLDFMLRVRDPNGRLCWWTWAGPRADAVARLGL